MYNFLQKKKNKFSRRFFIRMRSNMLHQSHLFNQKWNGATIKWTLINDQVYHQVIWIQNYFLLLKNVLGMLLLCCSIHASPSFLLNGSTATTRSVFHCRSDQYKRSVKWYKNSTMLNVEMPKYNPSNPPQIATKFVRL